MTLATTFLVLDPHPPEPLFRFGRALLGSEEATWDMSPAEERFGRMMPAEYCQHVGQGYPSVWTVHYATDGPLRSPWIDDGEDDPEGPSCLRANLDTAYSYRADGNGARCSDLHAWLVFELGMWCEERNLRYRWHQEFTGEWYDSILDVRELGDPDFGRLRPTPTDIAPLPPMKVASR